MNGTDIRRKNTLIDSLISSGNKILVKTPERNTESLLRFGIFNINGQDYQIISWSFKKGIVTFEKIGSNINVKYSIEENKTILNNFKKKPTFINFIDKIRLFLSIKLKDLSDKLHP